MVHTQVQDSFRHRSPNPTHVLCLKTAEPSGVLMGPIRAKLELAWIAHAGSAGTGRTANSSGTAVLEKNASLQKWANPLKSPDRGQDPNPQ